MTEASTCVICDGQIRRVRRAMAAPFLATRIWNRAPFPVDLVKCEACEFVFYNPRLDAADAARLYADYRGDAYQAMRHASEPWYTADFNRDLASPASYVVRRERLAAILQQHLGGRQVHRVLDHGGDRGDLVCGLIPGAEAYVYDISGVATVAGVTSTGNNPAACQADLIINSNVLEHVGFPRDVVREIVDAAPPGGLVFIEVPRESPFGWSRIARRVAQIGLMSLLHPGLALSLLRPASLYMMHEHINYFTEQTLSVLMRSQGLNVLAAGSYFMSGRSGSGEMSWCLGTA